HTDAQGVLASTSGHGHILSRDRRLADGHARGRADNGDRKAGAGNGRNGVSAVGSAVAVAGEGAGGDGSRDNGN
ncbi:hypothetical protein N0V85_009757, partial [Neurospora sp. IMI 360204]